MSAIVVHAIKLAFEVNVSDFLATPFYRNETIPKMFLIIIKD